MKIIEDFLIQVVAVGLFVLILVTLFPTESFLEKDVNAIYSIDIKHGVLILVDEDEQVLLVEGINQEAQNLVKSINYQKKSLGQVLEIIIEKTIISGDLKQEGTNYVLMSRLIKDKPAISEEKELTNIIYKSIDGKVSVIFYEANQETLAMARTKGVTPGVFLLEESLKKK